MSGRLHDPISFRSIDKGHAEHLRALSSQILRVSSHGISRIEFSREVSRILLDSTDCDVVELETVEDTKSLNCIARREPDQTVYIQISTMDLNGGKQQPRAATGDPDLKELCRDAVRGQLEYSPPFLTSYGSYWLAEGMEFQTSLQSDESAAHASRLPGSAGFHSLALIPFIIDDENTGFLQLKSRKRDYFWKNAVEYFESLAQTIGVAVTFRRLQEALRERVKELSCLYQIAQFAEQPELALDDLMNCVVQILPPSWLYPEVAIAEINLDGQSFATSSLEKVKHRQTAPIVIRDEGRGSVMVAYSEEKPELDEGPFLTEERNLIDTVAREIALIIERKEVEAEQEKLEEQLRHADRLSTIGQLAAGVAHELNEPLGSILGFAQLIGKNEELPVSAKRDVEKIVSASLYAREIIKNLMIFSRQVPAQKIPLDLNRVVEEALFFFEARCARAGIEVEHSLQEDLPEVMGDPAQLKQSVVNLAVNAIQAMTGGGRLSITTYAEDDAVALVIEDTGIGMNDEEKRQAFLPFFTTKDVGEGTGLGLAVVHGIVASHGGSILAESEVGQGSSFEIHLPRVGISTKPEATGDANTS
jgi:signal transduction histidine kinase